MPITLDGTTGITAAAFVGSGSELTGVFGSNMAVLNRSSDPMGFAVIYQNTRSTAIVLTAVVDNSTTGVGGVVVSRITYGIGATSVDAQNMALGINQQHYGDHAAITETAVTQTIVVPAGWYYYIVPRTIAGNQSNFSFGPRSYLLEYYNA